MIYMAKQKDAENLHGTVTARPGPELRDAFAATLDELNISMNEAFKALMTYWLDAPKTRRILLVRRLRARDLDEKLMSLIQGADVDAVESTIVSRVLQADAEMRSRMRQQDDDEAAQSARKKRPRKKK